MDANEFLLATGNETHNFNIFIPVLMTTMYFICIVGILGNILNIFVFSRGRSEVTILLLWLAVSDLLKLLSAFLAPLVSMYYEYRCVKCRYEFWASAFYLIGSAHTIHIGMNVILSFSRHLAVAQPLQTDARHRCIIKKAVMTVYVFGLVLNFPTIPWPFIFDFKENLLTQRLLVADPLLLFTSWIYPPIPLYNVVFWIVAALLLTVISVE